MSSQPLIIELDVSKRLLGYQRDFLTTKLALILRCLPTLKTGHLLQLLPCTNPPGISLLQMKENKMFNAFQHLKKSKNSDTSTAEQNCCFSLQEKCGNPHRGNSSWGGKNFFFKKNQHISYKQSGGARNVLTAQERLA